MRLFIAIDKKMERRKEVGKKPTEKHMKKLAEKMYYFFADYEDRGAPSFAKFARSIGFSTAELESRRSSRDFDQSYLWGSFAYTIYDFAIYNEIYSEKVKEIPEYGLKRVFDLRDIYGDFMSFTSPATDLSGRPIKYCRLYDGRVEVDADYTGEITISYRCLPEEISLAEDENATEIAVPKEYTHLFVMLVAYYYLYFSDNNKADRFINQYTDATKSLVTESYQQIDAKYLDTTGWA